MTSNNEYFKRIYETLSNRSVTGNHSDNYYLKQISLCYGNSYTSNKCNGKYLKDIAEQLTGKSYNKIHFRNYFLREIVMTVYQGTLTNNTDNYYLRLWSENCDSDSLVSSITLSCSANNIDIDRTFSLSGSLSVGAGKTVKIYENDVLLATVTTGVNGVFRLSDLYKSSTGVFTYQAKYEGDETYSRSSSERITVRVVKRNAVLSMSVQDDSVIYGEDIVLNGTLKYNGSNISDASVKIYKGNTLIDTISASTGTFRKTISGVSVGTHDFHAVFENTKYNTISTSNIIVTVSLKPTSLSINVPANLVYTDNFDITGVLTDGTNPISNANVDLLVGATVVDTATTNSNGQVVFTRTPVTVGTHTFQLHYAGNSDYSESSSSAINKEINKETSVLTVNSPSTSNYTMFEGQLSISGTLKTDDNEPIVGTILVKEGNSTLTTLSSNSNGSFNGNVNLTEGTHNLEIKYETTSYYTASSVSKTIVVKAPSLSLATDMSILSSIDDDYCVLSATLDDLNKSNKTVTFEVRKQSDDSLVESLTAKTNSSGIATVSYYGKGAGELHIKATCGLLIQTCDIIDTIKYYDSLTSVQTLSVPNLPTNFKCVFQVKPDNITESPSNAGWIEVGSDMNNLTLFGNIGSKGQIGIFVKINGSYVISDNSPCLSAQTWAELTYTYEDGVQTITDGTNTVTLTNSQITARDYIRFFNPATNRNPIKDLMFLPL